MVENFFISLHIYHNMFEEQTFFRNIKTFLKPCFLALSCLLLLQTHTSSLFYFLSFYLTSASLKQIILVSLADWVSNEPRIPFLVRNSLCKQSFKLFCEIINQNVVSYCCIKQNCWNLWSKEREKYVIFLDPSNRSFFKNIWLTTIT